VACPVESTAAQNVAVGHDTDSKIRVLSMVDGGDQIVPAFVEEVSRRPDPSYP
jgi:hypothetical protein